MVTLYPPPALPVFPAGFAPQAPDFAGWVTATLGFQLQGVMFRAVQANAQALSSGGTALSFDTVLEDPYSGWNAGSNQWLAPYTGWYQVDVFCSVAVAAVNLQVSVVVDNLTAYSTSQAELSSTTSGGGPAFAWVNLVAGTDFVTAQATPSSNQNTDVSHSGRQPSMNISFISQ
jgi:hypothetical protein